MYFWRLLSIGFLLLGVVLLALSLLEQDIRLFYFALASYGVASVIWLTIQKLYVNFTMPKNPRNNTDTSLGGSTIMEILDIILSFPKILFLFLIHMIYH